MKLCCQKYKSISLKKAEQVAQHEMHVGNQFFAVELFVFHLKSSKSLLLCRRYQKKKHCCLFILNFWQHTIQFKFFFSPFWGCSQEIIRLNRFSGVYCGWFLTWNMLHAKRQSVWHLNPKNTFSRSIERRAN